MAEEKAADSAKTSQVMEFRKKLMNREQLQATVTEGLKSTNAKVRALAVKMAFKLQDHKFIKQNVLSLIKSDKSKKVLRALSGKITRKDLIEKVKAARVKKKVGKATEAAGEAPAEKAAEKPA